MESKTITVIQKDAILDLKMSTGFYQRIQALLTYVLANKSTEDINRAHEAIKNNSEKEPWMFHYETLLIICKDFENLAKEQNKTEDLTIEEFEKRIKQELGE